MAPRPLTSPQPPQPTNAAGVPVEGWVTVVRPGLMLFEVAGVPESLAREALRLASNKLGIRTRFVARNTHA